jgi:FkbM family methyltransferase
MSIAGTSTRFRRRTLLELVAQAFPRGPGFDGLRRRISGAYEGMLDSDRLTSVLPGGEVIVVAPAHRHVTWNVEEYNAFRSAVRPGDTVIDAGANVGCYALLFGRWVGATGRVYAFEPDPRAFEGLSRHIDLNGLGAIVTPINMAISDRTRPNARFALAASSGISRLVDSQTEAETIAVPTTSIDDFCARYGVTPHVIKIDVEGAELEALRGARETIARAHDLQLFIEMHPSLWKTGGIAADDLRRECEAQRLTVERLDGINRDIWSLEGVALRLRPS